jgi:CHASE3 domain sensor protein
VNGRTELFLGIIAVATLAIAIAQLGVAVAAGLAARRLTKLAERMEQELRPIFGHLNSISQDASRAAALATAQVERADRLFADVATRIEQALATVQTTVETPAREGRALMSAFRAAFQAIRDLRHNGRRQGRGDDEDALFI